MTIPEKIGHYRILTKIGEGGMGEVYLAEDIRLGRKIVLKFLSGEFAVDSDRVRRLQREARAASGLNHPAIVVIHEIGNAEGIDFIASEVVEGQTLRNLLDTGSPQLPQILDIAVQLGAGLKVAHEAGIVHRDIKPENIMVRPDGLVKILDFGLAKITKIDPQLSATMKTDSGYILGTLPYMSPEQARGLELDPRTDIFSFSVVLYEMVKGRRPFDAETAGDTLVQILQQDPPPLNEAPEALQRIVAKGLHKKREERYQTMDSLLTDLKSFKQNLDFQAQLRRQTSSGRLTVALPRSTEQVSKLSASQNQQWRPFESLLRWVRKEPEVESIPVYPRLFQITFSESIEHYPALSSDGRRLAYCREIAGLRSIFLQDLDTRQEVQITKGEWDDIQSCWSVDGSKLLFVRGRQKGQKLEPVDVFGAYDGGELWCFDFKTGREVRWLENAFNPSFAPDGKQIAFDASWAGPRRIWICDENGHNPQQISSDSSEGVAHLRPRWSPDGARVVFQNVEKTNFNVRVLDCKTRQTTWITDDHIQNLNPVWSPSGKYIYFTSYRSGGLNVWRIRVGPEGKPLGVPQQLTAGAGQDLELAIAQNRNRLVFSILRQNADIWRLPLNPKTGNVAGKPQELITTTREDSRGAWSSDGSNIAFNSDRGGEMNLWLYSVRNQSVRQLTKGAAGDFQPNWSPDGKTIAFFSSRAGDPDIWTVDVENGSLKQLTNNESINVNPFYSPDGKLIVFQSDLTGRFELWVMNADGSDQRTLSRIGCGGHFMRWTRSGDAVLFMSRYHGKSDCFKVRLDGSEPELVPNIHGGAHISLSPDETLIMDVVGHKALWISPLGGGEPRKIFEFDDPSVRIDYPVWSPDGKWLLFDRFKPQGGDIWMMEDFE